MPNSSKLKGDRFERAAVLAANVYFPGAWRTRAGWDDDRGDIVCVPDYSIIQQVKDCQSRPWYRWLDELDIQMHNGGAVWGCVVSKRPGHLDAGQSMAIMRNRDWLKMAARIFELESVLASYRNGQPRATAIPEQGNANESHV